MADAKISALTAYTTPLTADLFPIVDVANSITKKITYGDLKTALFNSPTLVTPVLGVATATSLNGLTITSSTGTLTITNAKTFAVTNSLTLSGTDGNTLTFPSGNDTVVTLTASQTLTNKTLTTPTIASFVNATHNHQDNAGGGTLAAAALALVDDTTNNFSTTKHGFVPKGTNVGNFLKDDGTWASASTSVNKMTFSTIFETTGRFTSDVSGGTITFGTSGAVFDTTATLNRYAQLVVNHAGGKWLLGSPTFSFSFIWNGTPTTGTCFWGIGETTVDGTTATMTTNHIGFKVVVSGSTATLSYTQADGSTETAASLTTLAANDQIDIIAVVNASTSVTYYWRKNGGSLTATSAITTNMPATTTSGQIMAAYATNNNTGTAVGFNLLAYSYAR